MIALLAATLLTAQPAPLLPRTTRLQLVQEEISLIEDSRTSALWYLPAGALFIGGTVSMIAGVIGARLDSCRYYYAAPGCDAWAQAPAEAYMLLGAGAVMMVTGLVLTLVVDNLRYPANARLEVLYKQLSAVW